MILEHCHRASCTQIVESLQRELEQHKAVIKEQKEMYDKTTEYVTHLIGKHRDQSELIEKLAKALEKATSICWSNFNDSTERAFEKARDAYNNWKENK